MKHDTMAYHHAVKFGERSVSQWLDLLPILKFKQGVEEVCLRGPQLDYPYYVPPHQEALTDQHMLDQDMAVTFKMIDRSMDRFFQPIMPLPDPQIKSMMEQMRECVKQHDITFVTPKAPIDHRQDYLDLYRNISGRPVVKVTNEPDFYAFGLILTSPAPEGKVSFNEEIKGAHIRQSKRRDANAASFNVNFSFRDVIRSITGEDTVDQDLREVKELSPPEEPK